MFTDNGTAANPDKFQCMILSHQDLGIQKILLGEDTIIRSEMYVKVLGIIILNKLNFSEHTAQMCRKAARQLNALSRISRYPNIASRRIIYQSFIASNLTYCPVVWHFGGKVEITKLKRYTKEPCMRVIRRDYSSSYEDLLNNAGASTCLAT